MGLYLGSGRNVFILQCTYLLWDVLILVQTFTITLISNGHFYVLFYPLLLCNQHLALTKKTADSFWILGE